MYIDNKLIKYFLVDSVFTCIMYNVHIIYEYNSLHPISLYIDRKNNLDASSSVSIDVEIVRHKKKRKVCYCRLMTVCCVFIPPGKTPCGNFRSRARPRTLTRSRFKIADFSSLFCCSCNIRLYFSLYCLRLIYRRIFTLIPVKFFSHIISSLCRVFVFL